MALIDDLIRQKLDRLDSVPEALFTSVDKVQRDLLRDLLKLLDGLETQGGQIIYSTENLRKIDEITNRLQRLMFEGEYLQSVTTFANEIAVQSTLNQQILRQGGFSFNPDQEKYIQVIRTSQRQAIELMNRDAIVQRFLIPLRTKLQQSVTSEGGISDTIEKMREFMVGTPDKRGVLLGERFKTVVNDVYAVSDREYTRVISRDLEVKWYSFLGGLLKDSRCFCVERNGNIYHRLEIEEWGNDPDLWNKSGDECNGGGRNENTDQQTIFVLLGGYNCKHSLIPVSEAIVPADVIERVRGRFGSAA